MSIVLTMLIFVKSFIKNFFYFASTKLGQFLIVLCVAVFSIIYSYHLGFKNGVEFNKTEMAVKYQQELDIKLEEQKILQKKANDEAIDFILKNTQREIIYQDKIKEVEKIIKDSPQVSKKECGLDDKSFDAYIKTIKAIK